MILGLEAELVEEREREEFEQEMDCSKDRFHDEQTPQEEGEEEEEPCCCPWSTTPGTASGSSPRATTYFWWMRLSRCSAVHCTTVNSALH